MPRRRNKNNGRPKRAKRRPRGRVNLPVIVRPIHNCFLKYVSHLNGASNTGLQYIAVGYIANGLFDPAISATDASQPDGFVSLSDLYNNYIVLSCQIDLIVTNREDFNVNVGVGFYPGTKTFGSAAECLDNGEGPYGKSALLSAKGGMDRAKIIKRVALHTLWNKQYYFGEGSFQGNSAANPSIPATVYVTAVGASGTTMENGVGLNVRLTFKVRFSGRKGTDQVSISYDLSRPACLCTKTEYIV